jgi:ribosomal protein S18 acetylase RimI-like enzyme
MEFGFFDPGEYDQLISLWARAGLPFDGEKRDSRENLTRQCQDDHVAMPTLKDKGRLIGFIIATFDGRKGWINRLAIDPDYRRRQLASKLVKKAEEILIEMGANVIAALVNDDNSASQSLCRHCGYERCESIIYFRRKV